MRSRTEIKGGSIMLTTVLTVAATAYAIGFLDMVLWTETDGVMSLGR